MNKFFENSLKSAASLVHSVSEFTKENGPALASAAAVCGFITATILAAVKTPKAVEEFKEAGITTFEDVKENPKETAIIFAKNYWEPVAFVASSVTLNVLSNKEYNKRFTAVAAVAKAGTDTIESLRAVMREEIGEKKAKIVEEEAVNRLSSVNESTKVVQAYGGKTRFYDIMSSTYFYSDIETVNSVLRDLDVQICKSGSIDCDDGFIDANSGWREALGLDDIAGWNQFGWDRKVFNSMGMLNSDTKPISSLFIFGSKLDDDMQTSITIYYPLYEKKTCRLITRRN